MSDKPQYTQDSWPRSVTPGEKPDYSPPVVDPSGDFLTYMGFRWDRAQVPTVEASAADKGAK